MTISVFVVWSLVAGKMWDFSHDLGVVGRISQLVICYSSDNIGKRSMDRELVMYFR